MSLICLQSRHIEPRWGKVTPNRLMAKHVRTSPLQAKRVAQESRKAAGSKKKGTQQPFAASPLFPELYFAVEKRREAGELGFEPRLSGPEPLVLPLHHSPIGRLLFQRQTDPVGEAKTLLPSYVPTPRSGGRPLYSLGRYFLGHWSPARAHKPKSAEAFRQDDAGRRSVDPLRRRAVGHRQHRHFFRNNCQERRPALNKAPVGGSPTVAHTSRIRPLLFNKAPGGRVATMALLQVIRGLNPGQQFPLEGTRAVLGRHPECDIVLDIGGSSAGSMRKILCDGNQYFVEDLKSRNGTFVNGQLVQGKHRLYDNDRVKICDLLFTFHSQLPEAMRGDPTEDAGGTRTIADTSVTPTRRCSSTTRPMAARRSCRRSISIPAGPACKSPRIQK